MNKIFKKFKSDMSDTDFINLIVYLDSIDNGNLCEYDDDCLSYFYDSLYKICNRQIDSNISNTTYLTNRGETIGYFMNFLKQVGL
jgi:hypothetical protein